jgi:tRNA1(Val) A37 N6-methylase TrmN6
MIASKISYILCAASYGQDARGLMGAGNIFLNDHVTHDTVLGGKVKLTQLRRGHRVGMDAVLLAKAAAPFAKGCIADFGAGTGAVGLMIACLTPVQHVVLVERDENLARIALDNLAANDVTGEVIITDLLAKGTERYRDGITRERFDLIATNPPYDEHGTGRLSPDALKASAHAFPEGGLEKWCRSCADALKPGGILMMIHRADALRQCLDALEKRFGGVTITPVHPRKDAPAHRILIKSVKGSREKTILNTSVNL